jgi:predicted nucleotidyltransferase
MTRADIETVIIDVVAGEPRVLAAYLLGSFVRDSLRRDSDIDLALLLMPGQTMTAIERAELGASLAFRIGRDVDVGLISSHNLVYAHQVAFTGRRIFSRDVGRTDHDMTTLLGLYAQFQWDRREVLHAYSA